MKQILSAFLLIGLMAPGASAQTPVQITEQLIVQVKSKQSLNPAAEHIDWDSNFQQMDQAQKQQMGISCSEDLKKLELERYEGIGGTMKTRLEEVLQQSSPDKAGTLIVMRERLEKSLKAQSDAAKEAFAKVSYSVGASTIRDNEAEVELIKIMGDEKSSQRLYFVKVAGNWKLKSAAAFNPASTGNRLQSPFGASISSPDSALGRH